MQWELFIRSGDGAFTVWQRNPANISFMQKIFVALDEPDGIAGLTLMAGSSLSLEDKILFHRSAGNLHEAQLCYEKVNNS